MNEKKKVLEQDRQRLLAVERLIVELICFNFTSRMPFPYVIKIGRELKGPYFSSANSEFCLTHNPASKILTKFAWRLTIDRWGVVRSSFTFA